LAICYELSVPEHAEAAFKNEASAYIASVAKSADGVEKAGKRLSDIARKYSVPVLMSNCVGCCDNFENAGKTAAWNSDGLLIRQLDDAAEGILILDTNTQEVLTAPVQNLN
jgi:predicted amidohydrolase